MRVVADVLFRSSSSRRMGKQSPLQTLPALLEEREARRGFDPSFFVLRQVFVAFLPNIVLRSFSPTSGLRFVFEREQTFPLLLAKQHFAPCMNSIRFSVHFSSSCLFSRTGISPFSFPLSLFRVHQIAVKTSRRACPIHESRDTMFCRHHKNVMEGNTYYFSSCMEIKRK